MKTNAPEKIYCESDSLGNIVKVHNIKYPDDEAENIEYSRTDAFIEKALGWMISQGGVNDALSKEMIDDFRKYMKGE